MIYRFLARPLLIGAVLAVLGLGFAAKPPLATGGANGFVQGDVNCSGAVDATDALGILRSVAGLGTPAACLADAGDVNCDGAVNSIDSLRILRHVAALPNSTPDGCAAIAAKVAGDLN